MPWPWHLLKDYDCSVTDIFIVLGAPTAAANQPAAVSTLSSLLQQPYTQWMVPCQFTAYTWNDMLTHNDEKFKNNV